MNFRTHAPALIRYWRNTLADHDRRSVVRASESAPVSLADISLGSLPRALTLQLFERWERYIARQPKYTAETCDVNLAPVVVGLLTLKANDSKNETSYTVLWVPALLDRHSYLSPFPERLPWISREALEPSPSSGFGPIVASVEEYDTFLRASQPEPEDWSGVMDYVSLMVSRVMRQHVDQFESFGYQLQEPFVQLYPETLPSAGSLVMLYDAIAQGEAQGAPTAFDGLWGEFDRPAVMPGIDEARHVGQMEGRYALGAAQRAALHAGIAVGSGGIVAVNGPPGTGKTTLVQSVLASTVVESALATDGQPALLLATSTNNQAITNIQDVLANVAVPQGHPLFGNVLVSRWLPDVVSYALYLPASSRAIDAKRHPSYARVNGKIWEGLVAKMEDQEYVRSASEFYCAQAAKYCGAQRAVSQHVNALHEELVRAKAQFDVLLTAYERISAARKVVGKTELRARDEQAAALDDRISRCAAEIDRLQGERRALAFKAERLNTVAQDLRAAFAPVSAAERLAGFAPSVHRARFERLSDRARRLGVQLPVEFVRVLPSKAEVEAWLSEAFSGTSEQSKVAAIDLQMKQLETQAHSLGRQKGVNALRHRELESASTAWRSQTAQFYALVHPGRPVNPAAYDNPDALIADFDTSWRVYMFHLASRYWEGRWLLEMERLSGDETGLHGNGYAQTVARLRRFSMVTPLIVSTFHTAPRYFSYFSKMRKPLLGAVDLLIVDEAGQATPDVGAGVFALAKRAMVIGDVHQLEPIANTYSALDDRALTAAGLPIAELGERGYRAVDGSVMAMAREVSAFSDAGSKGMVLREHRRSFDRIAAFCNELVYRGDLQALRGEPKAGLYSLPQLGYAHAVGRSERLGGSVRNVPEAMLIAEWLTRRGPGLVQHYGKLGRKLTLGQLVGIITPFRAQAMEITKQLDALGIKDVEVGTVHSFQGAERPVILFSPVYVRKDAPFRFINARPNFLNVAVSRAQDAFIAFGDVDVFREPGFIGVLGKFLFDDPQAAIRDVSPLNRFPTDAQVETVKTLLGHRKIFGEVLENAKRRVLIAGPLVRLQSEAGFLSQMKALIAKGVEVVIVTDRLSYGRAERVTLAALEHAGVYLRVQQALHGCALTYDDAMIAEGGFNWLAIDFDVVPTREKITTVVYRGDQRERCITEAWELGAAVNELGRSA